MIKLTHILSTFLVSLLVVFVIYIEVSNKLKIKIVEILKVFGSIISLLSLFLVTYNNYINNKNNRITTIGNFRNHFSTNMENIIDILNADNVKQLRNEIIYEIQENKLEDTQINEKEFLAIFKILIIMDNLYLRLLQEEELFDRQFDFNTYYKLLIKIINSNKILYLWNQEKHIFHKEFITYVDNEIKNMKNK